MPVNIFNGLHVELVPHLNRELPETVLVSDLNIYPKIKYGEYG
jgi:hypothetical protein